MKAITHGVDEETMLPPASRIANGKVETEGERDVMARVISCVTMSQSVRRYARS